MSSLVVGIVLNAHLEISAPEKILLLHISEHAHPDGTNAYPSVLTLVGECGLSRRTIQRGLRSLEEKGLIVQTGTTPNGCQVYTVNISAMSHMTRGGVSVARGGRQAGAGGGVSVTPKPVLSNLSEEPPSPRARGVRRGGSSKTPEGFDTFWGEYPRRDARADAEKAWVQVGAAESSDLRAAILASIPRLKRSGCLQPNTTKDGRSTIPLPASFLRGKRWMDEAAPSPAPASLNGGAPAATSRAPSSPCPSCGGWATDSAGHCPRCHTGSGSGLTHLGEAIASTGILQGSNNPVDNGESDW